MPTDFFLNLKASYLRNTSITAGLARIGFPKPTATNAITRKEEAQMRYWHGAMVNVSGTGTETSLNVPYRFVRSSGLAIVVGLVKRAKT